MFDRGAANSPVRNPWRLKMRDDEAGGRDPDNTVIIL
jgi:hypothetical protein